MLRALSRQCLHLTKRRPSSICDIFPVQLSLSENNLHTSQRVCLFDARDKDHEEKSKSLIIKQRELFDTAAKKAKDKVTFQKAVQTYLKHEGPRRRGHVEFIYASLDMMKEFGVQRDLDTYKRILDLFPKEKMVARSTWQVEMMHYPKQQQCCIDLLDQMEHYAVLPDDDMGYRLIEIFGDRSHAFRKYQRMMYWMPKFKNANPYPLPMELPEDPAEVAILALKRMAVDLQNKVTVYRAEDLEVSPDHIFIASAQSPKQQELLKEHPQDRPVFVEGGFPVWVREKRLLYFILKAEVSPVIQVYEKHQKEEDEKDKEGIFTLDSILGEERPSEVVVAPSQHEQDDGTILAICITGTNSKDSLISWINLLQSSNPTLQNTPVVFSLRTPESGLVEFNDSEEKTDVSV